MFPDVLALVVAYLGTSIPSAHVCVELPPGEEFDAALPVVQITRVGGFSRNRYRHDEPVLDFDIYGPDLPTVNDLVDEVRGLVTALRNTVHSGAVVTSSREIAGPSARPETDANVTRLGFTAGLVVRAN